MASGRDFMLWQAVVLPKLAKGGITVGDYFELQVLNWGGEQVRVPRDRDLEREMRECPEALARFICGLMKKV